MPSAEWKKALDLVAKKTHNVVKDPWKQAKYIQLDSPRLNYIYGGEKGFRIGVIHRLMGPESGGKSTICTYIASQIQKKQPNKIVAYMDFERSFDPKHAQENGLNLDEDHFIYLGPDNLEEGSFALEQMIKTGELGCIVFDSESWAPTRTILEDELGKANFGAGAKLLKEFLIRFTPLCANYDCTLLIISQERANMAMMSHAITTTGGYALKYAGSTLMRVKKIEAIVQDGKDIGIHMLVRNFKNKTGVPNRQCEMDLYFLNGFDSTIEYVDFIKDFVEDPRMIPVMKAGAGGTYKSEKWNYSQRGRDNFIADIKKPEYAEMWLDIKTTIDQILADPGNELDKQRMTEDQMDDEEKSIAQELKLAERQEKAEGAVGDADSAQPDTVLCEEDEVQS